MKYELEIKPAAINDDLSKYAECIGLVRIDPQITASGPVFYLHDDVCDPSAHAYFLVHVKHDRFRTVGRAWFIVGDDEVYILNAERDAPQYNDFNRSYKSSPPTKPYITWQTKKYNMTVRYTQPAIGNTLMLVLKEVIRRYSNEITNEEDDKHTKSRDF